MRVLPVLLIAACAPGGGSDAGADAFDESAITCRTDPRAETYMAGMKKSGAALTFVLVQSDPSPPARGNDTWTVRVEQNGKPVGGATLEATPYMPLHGHGTPVVPTVTPSGDAYTITPLHFFMPGLWQVTIKATAGTTTDSAAFTFCIEG